MKWLLIAADNRDAKEHQAKHRELQDAAVVTLGNPSAVRGLSVDRLAATPLALERREFVGLLAMARFCLAMSRSSVLINTDDDPVSVARDVARRLAIARVGVACT